MSPTTPSGDTHAPPHLITHLLPLAFAAAALSFAGCGHRLERQRLTVGPGPAAALDRRLPPWLHDLRSRGTCGRGRAVGFRERDPALLADRLDRLRRLAQQAADCEAPFTVHLLTGSRSERVYHTVFDSPLGTEIARDRQVDQMAEEAMAAVAPTLEAATSATDSGAGSDPGAAYRVLADELALLEPGAGIDALVLSDGVTVTAAVDLNRSLDGADLDDLATQVAPAVDLGGRVAVDWPAVGRTADPAAPPGPWLDTLRSLWQRVCESRHAAACSVTTI
ncbi:MAG: hypothetical protein R2761_28095 [Acidimicrobiales bacterium]